VFFSGDTDCTPEIKRLKNITVAFVLGINKFRRNGAVCSRVQAKIFYPYHYGGQDTQQIADALKSTPGIEVRLRKLENSR